MLDEYVENQKIIYNIILNSIKSNKVSHAYLIENNSIKKGLDFAMAFSKFLLCPNHYTNNKRCEKCIQCEQIDNGDFLELEFIRPNGKNIKKEQIIKLQENFRYKPVIGNRKIYIIEHAELLNEESSNSMLKFLEEPNECIVAILVTTNMYQIYDTIRSRCQILKMIDIDSDNDSNYLINKVANYLYDNEDNKVIFLENNPQEIINIMIEYISYLEQNKLKTIIFKNKEILNTFNDIFDISSFFNFLIIFYKDVLNFMLGGKIEYFNACKNEIEEIVLNNNMASISNKLDLIISLGNNIKYNANTNLLLDKLVIDMSEV